MHIKPVRTIGCVLIEHRDDVRTAILLEANMRDVTLREEIFGAAGDGALRMLSNRGCPSRSRRQFHSYGFSF